MLEALDRLKTDIIESYTANGVINVNSDLTLNDLLRVNSNAYFNNNTYFNEDASFAKNVNIYGNIYAAGNTDEGNGVVHAQQFSIGDIKIENSTCSVNGTLAKTNDGTLLNCVNGEWVSAIAIASSSPVGTIVLWASTSIPDGWVEMMGQSTASYPELKALIGNTIPDMRGVFVRGLDNGRGLDSGRSIRSYQEDAIRNITGHFAADIADIGKPNRAGGVFYDSGAAWRGDSGSSSANETMRFRFDASRVVPTANENRPKNVALLYIIKAK